MTDHIYRTICITVALLISCVCSSWASTIVSFYGDIDFTNQRLNLTLETPAREGADHAPSTPPVTILAEKLSNLAYRLSVDVEHFQASVFDVSSDIEGSLEILQDSALEHFVSGKIWSQYSLIDYKPIRELNGQFEVKGDKLVIKSFSFGNLTGRGEIGLTAPYKVDMGVNLLAVDMNAFLDLWVAERSYEAKGDVTGEIKITGTLLQPQLKGNLRSFYGQIKKLAYDSIYLNAEGIYPHIEISNSTVSQTDGYSFNFSGAINLNDKKNFKKQIQSLTLAPVVSDSGSKMEWTIRKLRNNETGSTEIKYQLNKDDPLGANTSSDAEMFAVERVMEF